MNDQFVPADHQLVGAFAFALVVRPVPDRAPLFGRKLGLEPLDPGLI